MIADIRSKLLESRFDVPEDDDVHHEAQRAELVFLPLSITLAEFTPLAMKDRPRQLVSVLAKIARAKVPAAKRHRIAKLGAKASLGAPNPFVAASTSDSRGLENSPKRATSVEKTRAFTRFGREAFPHYGTAEPLRSS